tara:strand:- start:275 stop:862 length:588 start_codon:yes stop_codon:yes gene_type:complete
MQARTISMNINHRYHQSTEEITYEKDYIEAAQKDPSNFGFLYDKYYDSVFRFVFQRTADEHTAHDITSEVFFKALKNIQKYQFRGLPFSSWLLRVAQNETMAFFRKNTKRRVVKLKSDHLENLIEKIEEDHLEEFKPQLIHALKGLKESDLQLIEMRFFEGRAFKEIADITEKKESAVKMKLYRILDKLKGKFTV